MRRPAYKSAALPIAWSRYEYVDGRGKGFDYYEVRPEMRKELDEIKAKTGVDTYELSYIIDHYVRGRIAKDQPGVMPTDSVVVRVDKEAVLRSGMQLPGGKDSIPEYMTISFRGKNTLTKCDMMIYEMLARNEWKRPIYMSVTLGGLGSPNFAGLDDYLVLEGLAYRVTPFRHERSADGRPATVIDTGKMYDNMMNRFRYGNVNSPGIYLDETVMKMCYTHRNMFTILARQLLAEGQPEKALKVLRKCKEVLPPENIPYDQFDYDLARLWMYVGDKKEAARVAEVAGKRAVDYLRWAGTLSEGRMQNLLGTCRTMLSVIYEVHDCLTACDKQAAARFAASLHEVEGMPATQMVIDWMQQQQRQDAMQSLPAFGGEGDGTAGTAGL